MIIGEEFVALIAHDGQNDAMISFVRKHRAKLAGQNLIDNL